MYRRWGRRFGPYRTFPRSDICCGRAASVCFLCARQAIDGHVRSRHEALFVVPTFVSGIHRPCPSISIALSVLRHPRRIEDEHVSKTRTHMRPDTSAFPRRTLALQGENVQDCVGPNRRANVGTRRGGSFSGADAIGQPIGRRWNVSKKGGKTIGDGRQCT